MLPRRRYNDSVELSVIGFGGLVVSQMEQPAANTLVAKAFERGVNYFDVAPTYGDAEDRLGPALEPFRKNAFLACKTICRDGAAATAQIESSLARLRTDHFDLYQFHAVNTAAEVAQITAQGGALEAVLHARQQGKVRFVGFSSHAAQGAMAMMQAARFDSMLFPVNAACQAAGFGMTQEDGVTAVATSATGCGAGDGASAGCDVVKIARAGGLAVIALKALAKAARPKGTKGQYRKCWYDPLDDPAEMRQAMRFALGHDITSLIPPGNEVLFERALGLADDLTPLSDVERQGLMERSRQVTPLFQ